MTLATVNTMTLSGLSGELVRVEVDIADGLPGYNLLGLPDSALQESRDRVRSALVNSGYPWPNKRVTVSLSPAWLHKSGSGFDLPIAVALLIAQGILKGASLDTAIIQGELSLDGTVRPIRGVLPSLIAGKLLGINIALIPGENYSERIDGMSVVPINHLTEVIAYCETGVLNSPALLSPELPSTPTLDLSEVVGQRLPKQALELSAIGGHHLLLIGPPGTGKTMLAERLPGILPTLSPEKALQVAAIHSIAGSFDPSRFHARIPPFANPHHSVTTAAMVGGGSSHIRPGSCSLAHGGVLFIDEAPECSSGVLDALRQPLEKREVTITRSKGSVNYPADFILILAANPCPCGKYSGRGRACTCSSQQIRKYQQKLSGPLLDRIDIRTFVEVPSRIEMSSIEDGESSHVVRARVEQARAIAAERFKDEPWRLNSEIPAQFLRSKYKANRAGMAILHNELDKDRLSARGFHKVQRVAWSIADRVGKEIPGSDEVEYALTLRESASI